MVREFPRISRSQAATLVRWSDFVLRTGSRGPRLTVQDERGRAVHVPLRITSADQLTLVAPKLPFGRAHKAAKVLGLMHQNTLPDNDPWRTVTDVLADQTQDIPRRRERGDVHFRSLQEAFIAVRDHGSDDAVREAAAHHVSMYVEPSNVAEVRKQATTLGPNVAHWLEGLFAPTFAPTKITEEPFPWAVVPLENGGVITGGTHPGLHTQVDGVWTYEPLPGLPERWAAGRAVGDGFITDLGSPGTLQTWHGADGVWARQDVTLAKGRNVSVVLGNRILLLPKDNKTTDIREARPVVDVVLNSDGETRKRTWYLPVTHLQDAIAFDDNAFVVCSKQGVHHVTLGPEDGHASKLTSQISPWVAKVGKDMLAISTGKGIELWQRGAPTWSRVTLVADKKVTRLWGHGEGLISRHEGEALLRLSQRKADGWQWHHIAVPSANIRDLWSAGDNLVIRDANFHVQVWSLKAPHIDFADGRPDATNIETALQAQRLQKAYELWQAGERPQEAAVLGAARDANAPLACLARNVDVRSAAGDTLVGLALKEGKMDSAALHLLHGLRCDRADVDFALAHADSSVVAALLGRGILTVDDPRLLQLPAETTLWLTLQTFAMAFSGTGLRLIERGFPIFPSMEDAQASAFAEASLRLFAALKDKPYHLTLALMQAPETLRSSSGVDMANLATALAGDTCMRPLLRQLTVLPGIPWHASSWENQPQDAGTLQLLRDSGVPAFALARIAAYRPLSNKPIPPLYAPRASWLAAARPPAVHVVYHKVERQAAQAGDEYACKEMVRYLTQLACDGRGTPRVRFNEEPGVDQGGLRREWFGMAIKALFNTERGAFVPAGQAAYLTLNSEESDAARENHWLAAGRLVGHCLSDGFPMGLRLAPTLVSMMTGRVPSPEMLAQTDPALIWLPRMLGKACEGDNGLTFNAPDGTPFITHGDRIDVTESNKRAFAQAFSAYMPSSETFLRGVFDVIPGRILEKLSVQELSDLIAGSLTIDKDDFLKHIKYSVRNGDPLIKDNDPRVNMFEAVVNNYDQTELRRLLFLVTNLIAVPAEGFKAMRFNVEFKEKVAVPFSHTCDFTLDVPITKDVETLEEKMALFLVQDTAYGIP